MNLKTLSTGLLLVAVLCGAAANLPAQEKQEQSAAFTPELTGYMYYSHDLSEGDGKSNSFEISRMYFGGKYKLSDRFTARFLSDMAHENGGEFELFAKYAYLDWKMNALPGNLIFGLQSTFNWKSVEKDWSYRVIRKAPMESFGDFWGDMRLGYLNRLQQRSQALAATSPEESARLARQRGDFAHGSRSRMGSSADLGAALSLKPGGNFYLDLMLLNGAGYKKAEDDRYKNIQARVGNYLFGGRLHLNGYLELEPWSAPDPNGGESGFTNVQWDLAASWSEKGRYLIGVDLNSKRFDGSWEKITATCFSVFGHANLGRPDLKALLRFDRYDSGFNESRLSGESGALKTDGSLFVAGLDFMADSRVHLIPNVQVLSFEDGSRDRWTAFYIHALVTF